MLTCCRNSRRRVFRSVAEINQNIHALTSRARKQAKMSLRARPFGDIGPDENSRVFTRIFDGAVVRVPRPTAPLRSRLVSTAGSEGCVTMAAVRGSFSRRTLLAAPFVVRELISKPRSSTVRLAAFGADGMAFVTLEQIARHPKVKLVCVAEVDAAKVAPTKNKFPDVRVYQDWREMIAKEKHNIDAACIGTPDHMHAPQGLSSMHAGWHVYQQKPLAHDLHEVRQLAITARQTT